MNRVDRAKGIEMNKIEKANEAKKEAKRKRERLATENLSEGYIRKLIRASMLRYGSKISSADIPSEVIEAKRMVVKMRRLCWKLLKK